jgi:hypothetical protein
MRKSALLLIVSSFACNSDSPETAPYTAIDSAGVRIIESTHPAWRSHPPRIDPQPYLKIGQEIERPNQFGSVIDGVLMANGLIAVADIMAAQVLIFDSLGKQVRKLGGKGRGPAEFQLLAAIFDFPGDSVAAADQLLSKTVIFSLSNDHSRSIQNSVQGNYVPFGLLGRGPFLLFNPGQFRRDLLEGLQWDSTNIVAMNPADGSTRTVARLPVFQRLIGPTASRRSLIPAHVSIQAAASNGFYWATSDKYEIAFYDSAGSLRRILRRPVSPRTVNDSLIAVHEEALLDQVRRFEGEARVPNYRRDFDEGEHGPTVPLFGKAFVDQDQRLWISESTWPSLDFRPSRWSLFSPEGFWLGDLEVINGLEVLDARGETVLGIWRNELDVQFVQLHRLVLGS